MSSPAAMERISSLPRTLQFPVRCTVRARWGQPDHTVELCFELQPAVTLGALAPFVPVAMASAPSILVGGWTCRSARSSA